jgi:hypothetical protein
MQERAKIRLVVSDLMQGKKLGLDLSYRADGQTDKLTEEGIDVISVNGVKYIKAVDLLKHL